MGLVLGDTKEMSDDYKEANKVITTDNGVTIIVYTDLPSRWRVPRVSW